MRTPARVARPRGGRRRSRGGFDRALVAALAVALLATIPLAATAAPADPSAPGGLQIIPVSTQHWLGSNDVLLEVLDEEGRSLASDGTPLSISLAPPDGGHPLEALPAVERTASYGRALYRARVPFHVTGRWSVSTTAIDGSGRSGTSQLQVSDDMGTPPLGSKVPGGATPTLRDAGSLLRAISSDPEPLGAFYVSSLDEALANGQPLAFVVDSYAYRPNAACGGALGILHEIFIEYPALTVVHAEPWRMRLSEGQLTLDPPGGPAVLADWSLAWGISEPPWVFVVDVHGRLHAKFTGVLGTDELRTALSAVMPPKAPSA